MSGRAKLHRKMARKVINGKISVAEARMRLGWDARGYPSTLPGRAVTKAAKPGTVKAGDPAAVNLALARQVLAAADAESRDPWLRAMREAGRGTA
jgi:hypothetical protein